MPVELGYTVLLALKKTFRLPNQSTDPDPRDISEFTLQDRLEFIFNEIKLDESTFYDYNWEFDKEYFEEIHGVDISGLEDKYYILVRDGTYDKADYEGDPDKRYNDYLYEPLYKRYGNVYKRKNLFDDKLILLLSYFEGGFPEPE